MPQRLPRQEERQQDHCHGEVDRATECHDDPEEGNGGDHRVSDLAAEALPRPLEVEQGADETAHEVGGGAEREDARARLSRATG